jgi:cell division protein FtsX
MQSRADTLDNSQASEKSTESVLLKQEISNNNNRKKVLQVRETLLHRRRGIEKVTRSRRESKLTQLGAAVGEKRKE